MHNYEHITPLPPVREAVWKSHEKNVLCDLILTVVEHHDYTLLSLYCKATALSIGSFTIGSITTSRFVTRAHIMAKHSRYPDRLFLAKIEHFAEVNFEDNKSSKVRSVWTACVSFYDEHDYKKWFGGPTEVWTRSIFDITYICLPAIKCQVAFCETDVNFGSSIGKQTVYVVSLLSNVST